ncbi:MAG: malto-oligosyltrehalose synthase [Chryseolinea sp.]
MYNPGSTYRLQFNKHFKFSDAEQLVDYFETLGIKTIYASPIFKAVPGSLHGYDVTNPYEINPEIGSLDDLRKLTGSLKHAGIGWIQDIVPNHMAFHHSNPWLWDVLEKGSMSVYSDFFDITWAGDFYKGRLMAPFLGASLEEVIQDKGLKIIVWQNRLCFKYGDQYYPLNSRSYATVLNNESAHENIGSFLKQLSELHHITDHVQYALRWHEILLQFAAILGQHKLRVEVDKTLTSFIDDADRLAKLADEQFYRLCHWNETDSQITYRRFFLVNGLICLNMQSDKVFSRYHEAVHQLLAEGVFQGLRVDHIDGLFDPLQYLNRLRVLCGPECYIVVEKILEAGEALPKSWPIQGTTGYEFLSAVNNVFTRTGAENKFNSIYKPLAENSKSIPLKIRDKKELILSRYMQGELSNLYRYFIEHEHAVDAEVFPEEIKSAIAELLIQMPVYRFYGNSFPLRSSEQRLVRQLLKRSKISKPDLIHAFDVLEHTLLNDDVSGPATDALTFYQRFMQFSGPLMAKGVEDTLMYTFNRFVGHNEVGDSPESFGISTDEFHLQMTDRQQRWPLALNATSTHDTKRGEDVRTRLNVLPDLANEWKQLVSEWSTANDAFKNDDAPDENDEYLIYQTLVGVYPHRDESDFLQRMDDYLIKALREAKRHSDWAAPDEQYEAAVTNFVRSILQPESEFMKSFMPFQKRVSDYGLINSLSQLILKLTCPGVPDIYQGTTGWDLSMVDPDNRRLIDFDKHKDWLKSLDAPDLSLSKLWAGRSDSKIKLWIVLELLKLRNSQSDLFTKGDYIPLEIQGRHADNCLAFARRMGSHWVVIAIPLNIARISDDLLEIDWSNTSIVIPDDFPKSWLHLFSHSAGTHIGSIALSDIFVELPFAVLSLNEVSRERSAGVLLSLTSLPSAFGIGDMGPAARNFARFLATGKQKIWQVLPLNPTNQDSTYSPYSSYSAMAGNVSLISIEDLVESELLEQSDIDGFKISNEGAANFLKANECRATLLTKAYENFKRFGHSLTSGFERFSKEESYWLDDFVLFELLKDEYGTSNWSAWPEDIRDRDEVVLTQFTAMHREAIERVKWMQYIFSNQWNRLREFCGILSIKILGDLPFYVSYNSADVWAHRDVFKLDEAGGMQGVAGVPPDYFAETGQLWGMPVFNWRNMQKDNYRWFVKRIKKNLELFDILRLDHFRAFVNYWEVPKGETTAVNGKWMDGPGLNLFEALREQIGGLPFVAEDLGEIDEKVSSLREALNLPGMKVLQFAFGDGDNESDHISYLHHKNFIVYTGTHDNNTTRGWYRKDISPKLKKKLDLYFARKINSGNVTSTFIREAYASVAATAIIPMQDLMDLGERSRMNTPSTTKSNWLWRMRSEADEDIAATLRHLIVTYGRG